MVSISPEAILSQLSQYPSWAVSLGVFLFFYSVFYVLKFYVLSFLRKKAQETKSELDDFIVSVVDSIGWPFYFFFSIYLASLFLPLPSVVHDILLSLVILIMGIYLLKIVSNTIDFAIDFISYKLLKEPLDATLRQMFKNITKFALGFFIFLLVLSNLGVDVTSLLAGAGVVGLAVAFASQRILEDIFAYFSIIIDKPFRVGDFIVVSNEHKGTVESIGIKSCRIRSIEGELLVISNKDLTDSRIRNYGRIKMRRAIISIGLEYGTPKEKIERALKIIEDTLKSMPKVMFERAHFKTYGEYALILEVTFWVKTSDYVEYLNTLQAFNLRIYEEFAKEGISMAFPTYTVHLKQGVSQKRKRKKP